VLTLSKAALRKYYKSLVIPEMASRCDQLLYKLTPILPKEGLVLSYSSLPYEVDTQLVNTMLLEEGRLALPKVRDNGTLSLYKVENFKNLTKSKWGIQEPYGSKEILPEDIACALIPGVAFDITGARLGHGKGFYDRLLPILDCSIGITFKERLTTDNLPLEPHDRKVHQVIWV
jgi:5-formyltetrahydrofolate cyclo-ligase